MQRLLQQRTRWSWMTFKQLLAGTASPLAAQARRRSRITDGESTTGRNALAPNRLEWFLWKNLLQDSNRGPLNNKPTMRATRPLPRPGAQYFETHKLVWCCYEHQKEIQTSELFYRYLLLQLMCQKQDFECFIRRVSQISTPIGS